MTPIDLNTLPDKLQKKYQSLTSGGLIAHLVIDERYKGQGFAEWLLIDALRKLLAASYSVAFPVVIVDAKEGAPDFDSWATTNQREIIFNSDAYSFFVPLLCSGTSRKNIQ